MSLEMVVEDGRRQFRFRPVRVPVSDDGLFPADAAIRRVYADAVCGLGAGTALLLQLAHPSVAQGVHDHSDFERRPLDRLFGTLYATNAVVFGSNADAVAVGDAIGRVHRGVRGPGYRALDPDLLCWVNATLLGTAVQLYQRLIEPLTLAELDELAADSRKVGEVFGCPLEAQPSTWTEFQAYWRTTIDSLEVSDTARLVATSLLSGRGLPMRVAWRPTLFVARTLTAATLPPRLRREYGLPWRALDRALAEATLRSARLVLPRMPVRWRTVGPELLRAPELRAA